MIKVYKGNHEAVNEQMSVFVAFRLNVRYEPCGQMYTPAADVREATADAV